MTTRQPKGGPRVGPRRPGLSAAARAHPRFFGAMVVDALGSGLFLPFSLVYFLTVTDLGVAGVGAAIALSKLVSIPFGLAAGGAVDRWGAFAVARLGNYVRAGGFLLFLAPRPTWLVPVALTVVALGDRAYWSAHGTMIGEVASASLDDWFALTAVARNAGLGLGGLFAAVAVSVGDALGLRLLVLANAVSFVVAALLLTGMRDGRVGARGPRARAGGRWAVVLRDGRFLRLVAVKLAFVYCAVVLPVMVPVFLDTGLGLPVGLGGVLFAVNCALVVLGQSRVVAVTRGRRVPAIAAAGVLYAVAAGLFVAADVPWPAVAVLSCLAAIVVYTVGEMAVAPASDALATDLAPRRLRGRYLSLYATAWSAGSVLGPLAATAAFAVDPLLFWAVFAVVALGGALGAISLRAGRPPEPDPDSPAGPGGPS